MENLEGMLETTMKSIRQEVDSDKVDSSQKQTIELIVIF